MFKGDTHVQLVWVFALVDFLHKVGNLQPNLCQPQTQEVRWKLADPPKTNGTVEFPESLASDYPLFHSGSFRQLRRTTKPAGDTSMPISDMSCESPALERKTCSCVATGTFNELASCFALNLPKGFERSWPFGFMAAKLQAAQNGF